MPEPRAERPHMPGYGIDDDGDLLPWTWALERLTRVDDHDRIVAFATPYEAKYGTTYGLDFFLANACFRLEPRWAFGLVEADFTGTPTRWVF